MSLYRTHGPTADRTVEEDFEGKLFGITERGTIIPGSVSGGVFVPSLTHRDQVYLVDRVQRDVDVLSSFVGITDLQREAFRDIYFEAGVGSTDTVILVREPSVVPDAGSSSGHVLHVIDVDTGIVRPSSGYEVDSIFANQISLAAPMLEAVPSDGAPCILVAKRKLLPRPADFPNQSIGFVTAAKQHVLEKPTGAIYRATAGTDLAKITTGLQVCDLPVGFVDGNANVTVTHKRRGRWDDGSIASTLSSSAQAQLRRGTTAQTLGFDGEPGELTYDTDRKLLVAHDGSTLGGEPAAKLERFSTTEHDTGRRAGASVVWERSYVYDLTVDGSGNIPFLGTAHGIAGLIFNDATKPVFIEATWHLGGAAAVSGCYAAPTQIAAGVSYSVVMDASSFYVKVTAHTLGALRLFMRLLYCRT